MVQIRTPLSLIRTIIASFYPSYFIEPRYVKWMYPQIQKLKFLIAESGYFHIQATKPDTIGECLRHITLYCQNLIIYLRSCLAR